MIENILFVNILIFFFWVQLLGFLVALDAFLDGIVSRRIKRWLGEKHDS